MKLGNMINISRIINRINTDRKYASNKSRMKKRLLNMDLECNTKLEILLVQEIIYLEGHNPKRNEDIFSIRDIMMDNGKLFDLDYYNSLTHPKKRQYKKKHKISKQVKEEKKRLNLECLETCHWPYIPSNIRIFVYDNSKKDWFNEIQEDLEEGSE